MHSDIFNLMKISVNVLGSNYKWHLLRSKLWGEMIDKLWRNYQIIKFQPFNPRVWLTGSVMDQARNKNFLHSSPLLSLLSRMTAEGSQISQSRYLQSQSLTKCSLGPLSSKGSGISNIFAAAARYQVVTWRRWDNPLSVVIIIKLVPPCLASSLAWSVPAVPAEH